MKRLRSLAVALLLAGSLVACGGGGGSSPPPPPDPTAGPRAASLTLTVRINDAAVPSADSYAVKDGDTVDVSANSSVSWTSTSPGVTLSIKSINATQWSASFIKTASAPASVTLAAAGGGVTKTITFNLAATDARNGSYKVFAANGSRVQLNLNFDTGTYGFSGSSAGDPDVSGVFSADDHETGTYVFSSSRVTTAVNTARFRLKGDTIVGAFPFIDVQSPTNHVIKPFVASRSLETNQAAIDGVFNRLGITIGATASQARQLEISGGGKVMRQCGDDAVADMAHCPASSLMVYSIQSGSTDGTWNFFDANGALAGSFAMAVHAGSHIYLSAGQHIPSSQDRVFRIGLPESASWPTGTGHGTSTAGSWGAVNMQATTSTRTGIASDGAAIQATNTYTDMGAGHPAAVRQIRGANDLYFAAQGAGVFAIVGANDQAGKTAGYMQVNLMD